MTEAQAQERREQDLQWKESVDWHMRTTTQQIANLDKKVEANTEVTMASSGKVDEVHEILTAAKGFFKVAKWVGIALKWLGASCAAISAAIILYFQVMKK